MTSIDPRRSRLERARRRYVPTLNNIPGMGAVEQRLLARDWKPKMLAEPPAGSGLKPVMGDAGLPLIGHTIEFFRGGFFFARHLYQKHGPLFFSDVPLLGSVNVLGPEAVKEVLSNKNKDFSQSGWYPIIGPFFWRGLMLLDFDEHLHHRRIMQEAFTRSRLTSYVEQMDRVATAVVADWPSNDARFLLHPAAKKLTLDIASLVFMGHEPGTDDELVARVNHAFTTTVRAGGSLIRYPVPPFKWWRGVRARKLLEHYYADRVKERRGSDGTDMLTVLCDTEDDDGNRFSDTDIINHMIMLMMAAHDTSTTTITTMMYHLAAHPEWQERARNESARLGDGPLDVDSLEKLETLDLVMNESLRLVAPLPFVLRKTVRDTELMGHYLPEGTLTMVWPSVSHRLPELWTDPDTFDPERFAEPRNEHKNHRYGFAPFGGGAHKCIGSVFGRLEIKTVMHRLLRQYRLEPAYPGHEPQWDYGGMPIPIDGMPIMLRPLRNDANAAPQSAPAAAPGC